MFAATFVEIGRLEYSMRVVVVLIGMTLFVPEVSAGPGRPPSELPECAVTIDSAFDTDSIFPPKGNSDRYARPSAAEQNALYRSIRAAVEGDSEAWGHAFEAGYMLCARPEDHTLLWRPALPGTGWAIVAVRIQRASKIVLEVPHPLFDSGTLRQGRDGFRDFRVRALIASGTHRCANASPTPCGGTTRVCGDRLEPYRESDVAHAVHSMFHVAHRALDDAYPDHAFVSLHAMADAGISLSDGTSIATSSTSPVAKLLYAFEDEFETALVTGCNDAPHTTASDHLCGTTNVQGRYTNGVEDRACVETATRSSGRFFHVEQSAAVRKRRRRVLETITRALR